MLISFESLFLTLLLGGGILIQVGCFSFNFSKFFDHNAFEFLMLSPSYIYLHV
jgi:hypothetical protein